ncbi:MAG: NAD(P)/FAD-dependent oxidoreductase [Burkholderiaceae bacterium]|nr:NAD(P)/FAD-dependent oxidoreductase [Burkholderiaceae bacterium]
MSQPFDLIVIGAGAAGLFCASVAGQRGLRVAVVDHWPRLAEKIRISGGGRCNFTNLSADRHERFTGEDPRFARTALRAYPPRRFIELVRRHGIGFHEKHKGQLFCDDSAERIVAMLREECDRAGVAWYRPCRVDSVVRRDAGEAGSARFALQTEAGALAARALVVATGGLSIPKIGATDLGYRIARQFGLRVVEPRPALVPLTFDAAGWAPFAELSGVSLPVRIGAPQAPAAPVFDEDLLFTHRGLSGPAVLQVSTFWRPGAPIAVDLAPGGDLASELIAARSGARSQLASLLAMRVPRRLATRWLQQPAWAALAERRLAEVGNRELAALAASLRDWRLVPSGTEGFRKAEVTVGGVATDGLDPRTMQALAVPGLYFIGEVVDVTGWLGGYNFQWAWASAFVAGQSIGAR